MEPESCPICNNTITYSGVGNRDAYSVNCEQCGKYIITRTALYNMRNSHYSERQVANISGWIQNNQNYEISTNSVENFYDLKTPNFSERIDKLLIGISKEVTRSGDLVNYNPRWVSYGSCINEHETFYLLDILKEINRIKEYSQYSYQIAANGWLRLEESERKNADSSQAFVAMWFTDKLKEFYDNGISKAVLQAGYTPHRVDQGEHNNKIDDEIISEIRKSKFIIADFTGHRGGVYYEAGFAKGLGLEVFWTCRDDDLENLHFDIRQYNCITWNRNNLDEFSSRLHYRIESVLGKGN